MYILGQTVKVCETSRSVGQTSDSQIQSERELRLVQQQIILSYSGGQDQQMKRKMNGTRINGSRVQRVNQNGNDM